jgi:hypothetical protein
VLAIRMTSPGDGDNEYAPCRDYAVDLQLNINLGSSVNIVGLQC